MGDHAWKIIVVEDEFDSEQLIYKILTYHGIDVQIVHNGKECLSLLDSVRPTFIVTDLAMPVMDGWETLSAIRANPQTETIPVVAMTAYHSSDVAEKALDAGFDAFFTKPISARYFVESLAKLIVMKAP